MMVFGFVMFFVGCCVEVFVRLCVWAVAHAFVSIAARADTLTDKSCTCMRARTRTRSF